MAISNHISQCTGPLFRSTSRAEWAPSTARFPFGLFLSGSSLTANVLTDRQIESLAHFDRERIVCSSFFESYLKLTATQPERVVHAKAAGAHGYFETTTTTGAEYSVADFLQTVGTKTPLTARFSTVGGESGSSDVVRDPRGFALKLRTKTVGCYRCGRNELVTPSAQGILDWVFNNTPVFFLRDPAKFPSRSNLIEE